MDIELFQPIVARWFSNRFGEPTAPQKRGWPEILAGRNTLIAAPTGSGKTLAAFLSCIDRLIRRGFDGSLSDATEVVYVSPLKALSNDVRKNLQVPLDEIRQLAADSGLTPPEVRVLVRTGDTPASERAGMLKRPPHILVTTPESLYLLLTAERSRQMLRSVRTIIVDEIHALARDKRGSHLSLSLERLVALCEQPPVRVGLSATVRPIDEIARFLVGATVADRENIDASEETATGERDSAPPCSIVDVGHVRELDMGIEVPPSDLSAVCSNEQWAEIYERLKQLIEAHRSTLIFVNTRRMAERVAHNLRQQIGEDSVAAHHGSLSREIRLGVEDRLKAGQLKAIVATASLELGIDIGFIDLVCQIGSPRSIATFLQRVGRSGHSLGVVPKGRLFPLTRDELLESLAMVRAVRRQRLDAIEMPAGPLDILAQQIVAATACEEWKEDELFALCRRAWPYRNLSRVDFEATVRMVSEGFGQGRRRAAYVHRDAINGRLRARRGARIAAITSGGAIPELADYRVVTETDRTFVGTINEDFAIESMAGDVFILGNTSWRVRHVRGGEVVVNDAQGAPATIPFWLGEAPARTIELSSEISELREEIARWVLEASPRFFEPQVQALDPEANGHGEVTNLAPAIEWLRQECNATESGAEQAARYVAAQLAAIGVVPTQKQIVFERFFDESGGMQLVIHSPFGGRINRAWGLAMRKRFCRSFDFELQASADDNGIVLAIGPQHSFPLDQMFTLVRPETGEHLLKQALLAVPLFTTRWRWNATRALAVLRMRSGKKVPPHLQRFRADDLLTSVFPAQTACPENLPGGDIPIPDHPLVNQTVHDCLHEAMDLDRWIGVLRDIESGKIEVVGRDTREPSPFSHQLLNAAPYAFLDDAPLEERRARAVSTRRSLDIEAVRDLGRLDPEAIAQVRSEAWPIVRDADELHDALLFMGALPASDGAAWSEWFDELITAGRAVELVPPGGSPLWVTTERLPLIAPAYPGASIERGTTSLDVSPGAAKSDAWVAMVRGRLECRGPQTAASIAADLGLETPNIQVALEALEGEGFAMRGRFTDAAQQSNNGQKSQAKVDEADSTEWCERRLLARIHRLTLDGLRRQIQPVEPADFIEFLLEHQHVTQAARAKGRQALVDIIEQLQGFEIPAGAWEQEILPSRLAEYDPAWLDELSLSGHVAWGRLAPPRKADDDLPSRANLTRVVPIALAFREDLQWLLEPEPKREQTNGNGAEPHDPSQPPCRLRGNAQAVFEALVSGGALFASDLAGRTGLLPTQLEEALGELAAVGLVTADGFAAIRSIVSRRGGGNYSGPRRRLDRWGRLATRSHASSGRWSLFARSSAAIKPEERAERWARQLLRRYGVVFRDLLARESAAPPWRLVVSALRRLESRGEIRGGRFIASVAGEQFATNDAVERLRQARERRRAKSGDCVIVSATDPTNLFGVLTNDARVPAVRRNRLAVRAGELVASVQAGTITFHAELDAATAAHLNRELKFSAVARQRAAQMPLEPRAARV